MREESNCYFIVSHMFTIQKKVVIVYKIFLYTYSYTDTNFPVDKDFLTSGEQSLSTIN